MKVLNKIEADFNNFVAGENDTFKNLRLKNFNEFKAIRMSKDNWKG